MDNHLGKVLVSLDILSRLKRANSLNLTTANALLSAHINSHQPQRLEVLNQVIGLSTMGLSPFVIPDSTVKAPIGLAVAENNINIGMFPHECHCLIAGQTGVGKTTLLNLIFSQGLMMGNQIWMFVRAKDTRSLLRLNNSILINSFDGSFKFNPLNPNGLSLYDYCNIFADVFIQSQNVYDGTKNYLIEHLSNLYRLFEENGKLPSMFDLFDYIKSKNHRRYSREASYQDSAINRLSGMLSGPLGKIFDCSVGHEEAFLNLHCIFEIENLTRQQQIFFVNLLVTKLFRYKLKTQTQNWSLCGIDDGNLLFDASLEKRPDQGMPIIHDLLSTVRKSKINVFCCTQTPHQIGASIHSNSAIKIMFSLANALDAEFMFRCIGNMTDEQKEFCHGLEARQIVIKNSLRFQTPVLGIIPEVEPLPEFTENEVHLNNRLIIRLLPAVIPRYQPENEIHCRREERQAGVKPEKQENKPKTENQIKEPEPADDKMKTLLWTINLNQYQKTLTEICKLAGFTAGTGSRLAKKCEKQNLIKVVQVRIGKGSPKYPVLLKPAYDILGIEEKKFFGKGAGQEHVLYQHLIAKHFKEILPNERVSIELHRGGKHIDVGIETNEKLIAVEVAMTSTHEAVNIEKDIMNAKADLVVTACKDEKVLNEVRKKISGLSSEMQKKVKICEVRDVLRAESLEEIVSTQMVF